MTVGSRDPARILPKGAPIPHSTDFIFLKYHMLEACAPLEGSESFVLHAFFSFLKAPKLLPLLFSSALSLKRVSVWPGEAQFSQKD